MTAAIRIDEQGRLDALYRYEVLDHAPAAEFEGVIDLVKSIFGVPKAAITLIDHDRQWFLTRRGIPDTETTRGRALCDYTIRGASVLRIEDLARDLRYQAHPITTEGVIRAYMGAPLTTPSGYNIGAVCVVDTKPRSFSDADAAVLMNFARLIVSQLELQVIANRDSLTGAVTRRRFRQAMTDELTRARGSGAPVALIAFDLDRFKAINDTHGHAAGDAVLSGAVAAAGSVLRDEDVIGRMGGEEFAILLRQAPPTEALAVAERVRAAIGAMTLPDYPALRVTASFGVVPLAPGIADIDDWIRRADALLYEAKAGGRDRCVTAAA
ncbi:sensor domain-containing diguanylate cyclase [Halodurantibacterium flavum]|uniref:diguanylate cyclase n=1 Tax=Halodurantibacterium flavum TaxID=1382802 RepID=A0ABW4S8G7_9RHOB